MLNDVDGRIVYVIYVTIGAVLFTLVTGIPVIAPVFIIACLLGLIDMNRRTVEAKEQANREAEEEARRTAERERAEERKTAKEEYIREQHILLVEKARRLEAKIERLNA